MRASRVVQCARLEALFFFLVADVHCIIQLLGLGVLSSRGRDAAAIIDYSHRSCPAGRQRPGDHEQRLQERPTRVVRPVHYMASQGTAKFQRLTQHR